MFMQNFRRQAKGITVFSKKACINHVILLGEFFFCLVVMYACLYTSSDISKRLFPRASSFDHF